MGILTIVLALVSSFMTGIGVKSIVQSFGLVAFTAMGHAALEVPAFGIALWLGCRPLLWLGMARFWNGQPDSFLEFVLRSLLWWVLLGVALLGGAALWEAAAGIPDRS